MDIIEEYKKELVALKEKHKKEERELIRKYAVMQFKYLEGDIIKNNVAIIKITSLHVGCDFSGLPYPIYRGLEYTKKLEPKKNGDRYDIHGNNGVELVKSK